MVKTKNDSKPDFVLLDDSFCYIIVPSCELTSFYSRNKVFTYAFSQKKTTTYYSAFAFDDTLTDILIAIFVRFLDIREYCSITLLVRIAEDNFAKCRR